MPKATPLPNIIDIRPVHFRPSEVNFEIGFEATTVIYRETSPENRSRRIDRRRGTSRRRYRPRYRRLFLDDKTLQKSWNFEKWIGRYLP